MDKTMIKPFIAARVAQELKDGDVVNLGIGLPTFVPNYLPEGVHITLHAENGIVGCGPKPSAEEAQPMYVTDAGGATASVAKGGCFIDSSTSFALVRGGHVDCTVLGALEVDQEGNLANWIIPGKKVPGMGGAMDLVVGAKKVIVAMEHTAKGNPKILKKCTLPLTAVKCISKIITEMCVFEVTPDGLVLREYNPEFSIDDIKNATEADFIVADDAKEIKVALPGA
ncbi:MAG: 3-oxoacid CoA-transferase subunit B [Roseburia sp.]